MDVLYIIEILLLVQGILSLVDGVRYRAFVRRSFLESPGDFTPKVSVIAPCKGKDTGLEENLRALFSQDYPDYEIIFVVASSEDPSRPLIQRLIAQHQNRVARLVVAGHRPDCSEKTNNLLKAIREVAADAEAFVFVDSDARAQPDWLRSLVAPLADGQVGAATGYRWYLPEKGGFWSSVLSAWNGSVATTLGEHRRNFAWGGSTAIRRDTFDRIGVASRWNRAASDDYALTRAVQEAGLYVRFVPRCLMVQREDVSLSSLLEFTTRQIIITRVYRPRVWWVGLVSHLLFNTGFFGGVAVASLGVLRGGHLYLQLMALGTLYLLGSTKGALRLRAAQEALPAEREELEKQWWMFCLLWFLVSLLFLYNFMRSAVTRRITWRGVRYELRSPTETIVIR